MEWNPEIKTFIREHLNDDTNQLLLSAQRDPGIDVPFAVTQITARRHIKEKLPEWYANEELLYPSRLSVEQCSSEQTARYKAKLLQGKRFCDLTGGLGVDCFYFSQHAEEALYVERFPDYCEAARHNFRILQAPQIQVINANTLEILNTLETDTFYIDPARRSKTNKRTFALTDCEPDVLQLKPLLLQKAQRTIVKTSPMADIEETLRLLPETQEIHIIAVKNECKELLFILSDIVPIQQREMIKIHAVHLHPKQTAEIFTFTIQEEKEAPLQVTSEIGNYLYEPHAALLKSGAFKLIALRYGLRKLHRHSHLYTSHEPCTQFPGRCIQIEKQFNFSNKLLKQLAQELPKANLTIRNFPMTVDEFRKRSGIKEGGNTYLFATTIANEEKIVLQTTAI